MSTHETQTHADLQRERMKIILADGMIECMELVLNELQEPKLAADPRTRQAYRVMGARMAARMPDELISDELRKHEVIIKAELIEAVYAQVRAHIRNQIAAARGWS